MYKEYTLVKDWKNIQPPRHNIITCDAWGVRGHWRTYKSGKKVFIKPFVKGKNRENYQGKEYRLFPKKAN